MVKRTGLGNKLYIGGYAVSNDIRSINTIGSPCAVFNTTGIDKSAMERLKGLGDGIIDLACYLNRTGLHVPASTLPTSDVVVTYAMSDTVGDVTGSLQAKQVNYDWSRDESGELLGAIQALGGGGYPTEWGVALTAGPHVFSGASSTASHDNVAATGGAAMYVQCIAFTGTDVTIELEQSSDDGAGDAWASLGTPLTATLTGIGGVRVDVPSSVTVEQYVRAAVSGTFSSATLLISFVGGA